MMNVPATTDANKAYAMKAAEFRSLPNDPQGMAILRQASQGPFGALALIEIDKRTRAELMSAVQQQNANQEQGNMLQQALQRQAQAQMMSKLANDERMGLNNIVAQAEQGALEFGQPVGGEASIGASEGAVPAGAGGGIVSFKGGGDVPGYAVGSLISLLPRAAPYAGRAVGAAGRFLKEYGPGLAAKAGLALPFGFMGSDEEEKATPVDRAVADYPDESKRGSATYLKDKDSKTPEGRLPYADSTAGEDKKAKPSETGIAALKTPQRETDPRKILASEDALLKEMGLGEYGAKAKESIEGRKTKAQELYGRALESEPYLAAAEAAGGGGKRMTGLQALAAAVGGAGKSAMGIRREERAAMEKITEGEEKLALAQDLYARGRVSDAQKLSRDAEKEIFDNQLKLRELGMKEKYYGDLGAAAKAKSAGVGGGAFKQDIAKLNTAIQDTLRAMQQTKDKTELAMLQQQLQILRAAQTRALMSGGISITDVED